ncbi:LOW QUALITY PROTEIN: protein sprouty homolog 2 [Pholidichthys leucotaenia]
MLSRSQNDGYGGGRRGSSPNCPSGPENDEGRPRPPQTYDGPENLNSNKETPLHAEPVLSLDQIRITGNGNEYTEGPPVVQRSPAAQCRQQSSDTRSNGQQETQKEKPYNLRNLQSLTLHGSTNASISSSLEDSQGSFRTSTESTFSNQRLLCRLENSDQIIRTQPKRSELNSDVLKSLNTEPPPVVVVQDSKANTNDGIHTYKCEDCGRCRCSQCRRPRILPSCWMCGRRCMCSAQSTVEYGTCACCIKGLFYHCSSDDEDTCTDKPFSCTQSHCCIRWVTVSLFSLFFPCLLCYLPAKGCVAICQCCYDRATRPGCRCKNSTVHCEHAEKQT